MSTLTGQGASRRWLANTGDVERMRPSRGMGAIAVVAARNDR